ncbi:MAG: hypothetical protein DBX47_02250 [Clostridiales bacterium]|nr:MAG: hypothetical protein DBX47_02250 [Clostridiales bacterium]
MEGEKEEMIKFVNLWKRLINNDSFLKIISVLIAVFLWFWIISTAKPTNKKEFQSIPVQISYEGSMPDKQGLMMLLADQNIFVNLVISGPRSNLFTFSENDIKATLNFSAVAAPGTYQLPVSVTLTDEHLSVESVSPQIMNISFAKKVTRDIAITSHNTEPAQGISLISKNIDINTVTVTGPEETVNSIEQARISYVCEGDIPQQCKIELLDGSGTSVDRTYLTLSNEAATVTDAVFSKQIAIKANVTDKTGLPVAGNISVAVAPMSVAVRGPYAALTVLNEISLDTLMVDINSLAQETTYAIPLPPLPSGLSYTEQPTVTIKVSPPVVAAVP